MIRFVVAAALLTLAAPAAAQPNATYRAVGTEPFWSVTIGGGRMVYDDAEGRRVSVPAPRARPMRLGRRYATRRLAVTILRGRECSDGMSDRRYADTVRVRVDGRSLEGCGGRTVPPETLADTSWEIVSIGGRAVPGGEQYRIEFSRDQVRGKAGCNSFSGGYRVGRDGLRAGPLAMTQMACPGPGMEHEQAFARILQDTVRLYYPDGLSLIVRGPAGEIRLRRLA